METQLTDVVLMVDDDEVSLVNFLKNNVVESQQLSFEDLQRVLSLDVEKQEFTYVGLVEVKRIK